MHNQRRGVPRARVAPPIPAAVTTGAYGFGSPALTGLAAGTAAPMWSWGLVWQGRSLRTPGRSPSRPRALVWLSTDWVLHVTSSIEEEAFGPHGRLVLINVQIMPGMIEQHGISVYGNISRADPDIMNASAFYRLTNYTSRLPVRVDSGLTVGVWFMGRR